MTRNNLKLPNFLRYYKTILGGEKSIKNAQQGLLIAISNLYTQGMTRAQVLNISQVFEARDFIQNKIGKGIQYPFAEKLIDYVYTRDEAYNPFGKWISFDYWLPLLVLHYAQQLKKQCTDSFQPYIMARLIFSLMIHSQINDPKRYLIYKDALNKRIENASAESTKTNLLALKSKIHQFKDGTIWVFENPNSFYRRAMLNQTTVTKFLSILGIDFYYDAYIGTGNDYGTRLWLFNIDKLESDVQQYKLRFKEEVINNISIGKQYISGLNLSDYFPNRLIKSYLDNYMRVGSNYINLPEFQENPLIRIKEKGRSMKYWIQSDFADYDFILYSLYNDPHNPGNPRKPLRKKHFSVYPDLTIIDKSIEVIKDKINSYSKTHPISSPAFPDTEGSHFEQIAKSKKIVQRISEIGIGFNIDKAKETQANKIEELKQIKIGIQPDDVMEAIKSAKMMQTEMEDDEIESEPSETEESSKKDVPYKQILLNSDQLKYQIQQLEQLIKIAEVGRYGKAGRVYGYFSPHGASTHRMTSRKISLHGVQREFRKGLFMAARGKELVSMDVSGQDITVTANMAKHFYCNPPEIFANRPEITELASKIEATLDRLKSRNEDGSLADEAKPIDFMSQKIEGIFHHRLKQKEGPNKYSTMTNEEAERLGFQFENQSYEAIRDYVKGAVYVKFYGGVMRLLRAGLDREWKS
jgi:hypothetical protein